MSRCKIAVPSSHHASVLKKKPRSKKRVNLFSSVGTTWHNITELRSLKSHLLVWSKQNKVGENIPKRLFGLGFWWHQSSLSTWHPIYNWFSNRCRPFFTPIPTSFRSTKPSSWWLPKVGFGAFTSKNFPTKIFLLQAFKVTEKFTIENYGSEKEKTSCLLAGNSRDSKKGWKWKKFNPVLISCSFFSSRS